MLLFGSSRNLLSSSLLCSANMCGGAASEEEVSQKKEAPYRFGGAWIPTGTFEFLQWADSTRILYQRTPAYVRSQESSLSAPGWIYNRLLFDTDLTNTLQ